MKFIDFETVSATSTPAHLSGATPASKATPPKKETLIARWDLIDGKLTCKWVIE